MTIALLQLSNFHRFIKQTLHTRDYHFRINGTNPWSQVLVEIYFCIYIF
jgi:hypothetical protein